MEHQFWPFNQMHQTLKDINQQLRKFQQQDLDYRHNLKQMSMIYELSYSQRERSGSLEMGRMRGIPFAQELQDIMPLSTPQLVQKYEDISETKRSNFKE